MSRTNDEDRRRAGAVRWCPTREPRPAYYEAPDEFPGIPTVLWCRLYRLMIARGLLDDDPAERLAGFLAITEDLVRADGTIPQARVMLETYAKWAKVSMVTAWADLRRLLRRGLVRQVQAAAPGIPARYRLSAPVAAVRRHMPDLPPDLARALRRHQAPEPPAEDQPEPDGGQDENPGGDDDLNSSCGGVNTTPSLREGYPQPPVGRGPRGTNRRSPRPHRGNHTGNDNGAFGLLARCRTEWGRQRGADRVPSLEELADLVPLTSKLLEVIARPGDVEQLLTTRVASAADLRRTLRWRMGRELRDAQRAEAARLTPEQEAAAEARAAEYYAARQAAERAAVGASRTVAYADRAREAVTLAKRIRAERKTSGTSGAASYAGTIAAREAARNEAALDRWRAETAPASTGQDHALEEIRRLLSGSPEEQSRARALAQLTASRARAGASPAAR